MLLDGVHVPLTTPFYPDGRVYFRKLEHNVRRYSLTPVNGLIALGQTAEAASLTDEEERDVLRTVAETAAPEKGLIATISHAGVLPAIALATYAASLRYDAVLLTLPNTMTPAWNSAEPTPEALTWFRGIADHSPVPVLIHSEAAGHTLPVATIAALAEHPNIVGVLEQSKHLSRVAAMRAVTSHIQRTATTTITFTAATERMLHPAVLAAPGGSGAFISADSLAGGAALAVAPEPPALKTRTKQVGFQVLWAYAADATESLRAGACGLAPPIAASVPQAVFEIWAAWKDGNHSLMSEKQARVAAAEPFFLQKGTPAIKFGTELSGYFGGRPRLPLLPLTAADANQLTGLLDGMRS